MSNVVVANQNLITFDDSRRELIRKTVARDLDANEFELLMAVAGSRGLDPVLKQIYGIKRDGKMTIQTAIDGYRLIAGRTGQYAGSDEPIFEMKEGRPFRCKITVYRLVQGQRCAFTATAYWEEYYPGERMGFMWKKMPHTMLAKVAEALALRKAFPADLSGIMVDEEMDQAAKDVTPPQEPMVPPSLIETPPKPVTNLEHSENVATQEPKRRDPRSVPIMNGFLKKHGTVGVAIDEEGLAAVQKSAWWFIDKVDPKAKDEESINKAVAKMSPENQMFVEAVRQISRAAVGDTAYDAAKAAK